MNAAPLLDRCRAAGVTVRADGDALAVTAPETAAAAALVRELAAHKAALLAALDASTPPPARRLIDPRPDLSDDSALWTRLLRLADLEDGAGAPDGVCAALHYVRCLGAALVRDAATGRLRIAPRMSAKVPVADDDGTELLADGDTGWSTPDEWGQTRRDVLLPHRDAIARLLREVAAEPEPAPVDEPAESEAA